MPGLRCMASLGVSAALCSARASVVRAGREEDVARPATTREA